MLTIDAYVTFLKYGTANSFNRANLLADIERPSVLNFIYILNFQGKLSFLNILVEGKNQEYATKVYRKFTANFGACINWRPSSLSKLTPY